MYSFLGILAFFERFFTQFFTQPVDLSIWIAASPFHRDRSHRRELGVPYIGGVNGPHLSSYAQSQRKPNLLAL